ncbi:methyl-coenzyme M reductase-associated protein Mmp3 [Methanotorris formicicus]|uniref:UPF0288 protein MetfoDRAFT_1581 n=1 Tax=Methanotorris formicicus Mc-S-70 TaxID=647171 RepID=H1L0K7_9EURY|nr:methanogenesis marker 3 protein [Methanotorris formicicus]EHP84691.1 methanogenesis marker protein 3 [Methanotorris formicicus Mc-S-70]
MNVIVNGKPKSGETLRDVIKDEPYVEGANIVIIKGSKKKVEKEVKKYVVKTTKGSITIAITENNESSKFWKENYKLFENKSLGWKSGVDVSFGAITIDLNVSPEKKRFKKWDVVLSLSGLDKNEGHLVFVKKDVEEMYGLENPKMGIVVGGKRVVSNLAKGDKIISIEPIRETKEEVDYLVTKDLDLKLEDNWEIYTYFEATFDELPKSVEHALAIMEDGFFEISENTNTYVADCRLQTLIIDEENFKDRDRGVITVRNIGSGTGKVYIYREGRVSSLSHTVVGRITKGMELIDFSENGILTVITNPKRLNAVGMTQKEAEEMFKEYGVEVVREGNTNDNAIIIEQIPEYTMEILKTKKVKIVGIEPDKLVYIKIFDKESPITAWYFRKTTGLTTRRVGRLKVYFKHKDLVMFEGNKEYAKGLLPENTPEDKVEANTIAVTNMVKRYKGMIGVRLSDSDKFGPTGETFEGTNLVAKIVKNAEYLMSVKNGDTVYLLEIK